jgi:hypothetical protein
LVLAQVTNLKINNATSNFSMTSGDTIKWEFDCPAGAAVNCEIWYDVNANGTIDPGTDVFYIAFTQIDGVASGQNGPGDLDGIANGHVIFYQPVGIAPGKYIFKFSNGGSSITETGTVQPLASPAHTISGHVTPPPGKSAQYIDVQIDRNGDNRPNSWDAFTDVSGNFQIAMSADTAGNPWYIQVQNNQYAPAILTPQDTSITIIGNPSGINLVFQAAAAQVAGYLKDDSGTPIENTVYISTSVGNFANISRYVQTDNTGLFQIGLLESDIEQTQSQHWMLSSTYNGNGISDHLIAQRTLPILHTSDSLFYNLISYKVNSTIQGAVQLDGKPLSFPVQVGASNPDTGASFVWTNNSGIFTMMVSDKIFNYNLFLQNYSVPANEMVPDLVVHAGQTGVVFNITTTSVRDGSAKIPAVFSFSQNYPNPFNPTTEIQFTVPSSGRAVLKVFNVLGQEVATLFDGEAAVGMVHQAQFNASNLASGIYFSRLEFGGKVQMKKMVLLK